MTATKKVTAIVGQPLQIVLQSSVGSTGYGWYLTALDGGLALYASCVHPSTPGVYGAPSKHAFDFLAIKEGTFTVEFSLLAPWRLDEPAQTETYEIEIKVPAKTASEDIEEAMQSQRFTNAEAVSPESASSIIMKYASPMIPTVLKYAAPMNMTMDGSPPILAYAAPSVPSMAATCQPGDPCQATLPPFTILYAAPMTQPMPMYAAPAANQAQALSAPSNMLYAAPPAYRTTQAMTAPVQSLYAAPMNLAYAAPCNPYTGCCC